MDEQDPRALRLPAAMLLIALLPTFTLIAAAILVTIWGKTEGAFELNLAADSHLEAALRLRALGTALLLGSVSLASIFYFGWTLRLFARRSQYILLAGYAISLAVGSAWILKQAGGTVETMMTEPVLCTPLSLGEVGAPGARWTLRVVPGGGSNAPEAWRAYSSLCDGLFAINDLQRTLLIFVLPALVLGAISCLANPEKPTLEAWGEQAQRLRNFLYLTAAMFVSGILFLSALLRWPGYAYYGASAESYQAHASGYVLFWGVAYTIYIAVYYVPIYALLSQQRRSLVSGSAQPAAAAALYEPVELAKLALGIFAPAIAGIAGDVLAF